MSLESLRTRLKKYEELPDKAKEFMQKNVYGKNGVTPLTGRIQKTVHVEPMGRGYYAIGPEAYSNYPYDRDWDHFPYGRVVRFGRRAVKPVKADKLRFYWKEHGYVERDFVSAWRPKSDFIEDTMKDLREYMDRI